MRMKEILGTIETEGDTCIINILVVELFNEQIN